MVRQVLESLNFIPNFGAINTIVTQIFTLPATDCNKFDFIGYGISDKNEDYLSEILRVVHIHFRRYFWDNWFNTIDKLNFNTLNTSGCVRLSDEVVQLWRQFIVTDPHRKHVNRWRHTKLHPIGMVGEWGGSSFEICISEAFSLYACHH